jgi:hypothetical protein
VIVKKIKFFWFIFSKQMLSQSGQISYITWSRDFTWIDGPITQSKWSIQFISCHFVHKPSAKKLSMDRCDHGIWLVHTVTQGYTRFQKGNRKIWDFMLHKIPKKEICITHTEFQKRKFDLDNVVQDLPKKEIWLNNAGQEVR